jgi:hypothetical protein
MDIHLYSSDTLGDGTWVHRGIVVHAEPDEYTMANVRLARHPDGHFIIIGKAMRIYSSLTVDGPYTQEPTPNIATYNNRPALDPDTGEYVQGLHRHKYGGGSLFLDDGFDNDGNPTVTAYYITSRKLLYDTAGVPLASRSVGIYKLQDDWLDFEADTAEVYWGPNMNREAMFLYKRNGMYYMSSSHTSGWRPSDTYFRNAWQLSGPWSEESQVAFVPALTETGSSVKSHGCQFRYLIDVGGDRWMFGGDRYPVKDPATWNPEDGRHIRIPVVWSNDVPTVYWRREWNVAAHDGTNTSSERHTRVPGVDL